MGNTKTEHDLVCIGCPLGCPLHVIMEEGQVLSVSGNTCPNGDKYARKEMTAPTRMLTSTVKVEGSTVRAVSVKTAADIPKEKIFDCMAALKGVTVKPPVKIGDILVENICDTGVSIVATKDVMQ